MARRWPPSSSRESNANVGRTTIQTAEDVGAEDTGTPLPGLMVVPAHPLGADGALVPPRLVALARGEEVVLGRSDESNVVLDDERLSRRHFSARWVGGAMLLTDLDSKNGTFLDGARLHGATERERPRVARLGSHLVIFLEDMRPVAGAGIGSQGDIVVGPRFGEALKQVAALASGSNTLHIHGETGAGKEVLARAFHREAAGEKAPFVAVNCATVVAALAERLLFGARRGAYSGADSDADGYIHAANGGTLFLDEIAELELPLQAKLLRVLETQEVMRVGGVHGERVDLRVCSATHGDLRKEMADGRFRSDLFYRLARPSVTVPPLRERLEEIPYLVARALAGLSSEGRGVSAHASLVEACLLRPWPGNTRELLVEVRAAGQIAIGEQAELVRDKHLAEEAGRDAAAPASTPTTAWPADEVIEATLVAENNNVSRAARKLGLHRTQLRRWLARRAPTA
jgi:transcriptional regulator of acetoin/glycerol metabolism